MTRVAADSKVSFIQAVPLFQGLSKKELAMVARVVDEVSIPQGKRLLPKAP